MTTQSPHLETMRFGWSKANPPQSVIALGPADLNPAHPEIPTEGFLKKIAGKMAGPGNDTPRAVIIPNALTRLGSPKAVRTFQWHLINGVFEELKRTHPEEVILEPGAVYANPYFTVRNQLEAFDEPHLDAFSVTGGQYKPTAPLISIVYGCNNNVRGGLPLLTDARQYCRDQNLQFSDVFEGGRLLRKHVNAVKKDYMINWNTKRRLNLTHDMAIVLLNNTYNGVLHAGSPVQVMKSKGAYRPINRIILNTFTKPLDYTRDLQRYINSSAGLDM